MKNRIVHMFSMATQVHYFYDHSNPPSMLCLDDLIATPVTKEEGEAIIDRMSGQPGQTWDLYDLKPPSPWAGREEDMPNTLSCIWEE